VVFAAHILIVGWHRVAGIVGLSSWAWFIWPVSDEFHCRIVSLRAEYL
jgi:hypothetical protein